MVQGFDGGGGPGHRNHMNRLLPLVVAFLCAPLFAQAPSQVVTAAALKVTARAERANATYQVGEKVTFTVSVVEKG